LGKSSKPYFYGGHEHIDRNIYDEWALNGEAFPNGNTVPITLCECVENLHAPSRTDED